MKTMYIKDVTTTNDFFFLFCLLHNSCHYSISVKKIWSRHYQNFQLTEFSNFTLHTLIDQ